MLAKDQKNRLIYNLYMIIERNFERCFLDGYEENFASRDDWRSTKTHPCETWLKIPINKGILGYC